MKRLFVFGDSYSTPHCCVEPKDSFWGLTALKLGVDVIINVSRGGNSWDSVCQLLVGLQKQYDYDWENDFFIIGIPSLERITTFDNFQDTEYCGAEIQMLDWEEHSVDVSCHRGLISHHYFGEDRFLITHSDRSWSETQVLRQLFFITKWLDNENAKYLICNLSRQLETNNIWGPSGFVLEYVKQHNRCLVFENTYRSVNEGIHLPADAKHNQDWDGHHGPAGNEHYYKISIEPALENIINNT